MRAATRTIAVVVLTGVLIASTSAGIAAASNAAKRITPEEPCTIFTTKQIEKAFGGPVSEGSGRRDLLICAWEVGIDPNAKPGGRFYAKQVYPNIINTSPTAKAAIEDERAIDSISNDDVRDVDKIGKNAYFNASKGAITVQVNKKYVFQIIWNPGSVSGPISAKDEKTLRKLAKSVVKRAPR
jgi:hypothetical protein